MSDPPTPIVASSVHGAPHAIRLFDDFERTDHAWARRTETGFSWWNRSAKQEIADLRVVIEDWFTRYPTSEAPRLARDFRSEDETKHVGAVFELFNHEQLYRAGYEVQPHPTVPGTNRTPDFLAIHDGQAAFYVEATLAAESKEEAATDRRLQEVMEIVNQLRANDWYVRVTRYGWPKSTVPVAKLELRERLERWICELDYEAEVERFRRDPYGPGKPFTWESQDITLEFEARPRIELRGLDFGAFALAEHGGDAMLMRTDAKIAAAVRGKASRYGQLDLPYLIAVNVLEFPVDADDVDQGLLQAWGGPRNPRNTRVSGVVLANVPNIAAAADFVPVLVSNPAAARPLGAHANAFRPFQGDIRVRSSTPLP